MYKIVKFIGKALRSVFCSRAFVGVGKIMWLLISKPIKWLFHAVSYSVTSLFYDKGSNPAVGSILYTIIFGMLCLGAFAIIRVII